MSDASLERTGDGRWAVSGSLDFDSVPRLWAELSPELDGRDAVLDLSGVSRANSAGLALLIEAHAHSRELGGTLRVHGLPASLSQLGHVSGLDALLAKLSA